MSTESDAMPGTRVESPAAETPTLPATRLLYWSVRRELWESRSTYIAPLAVAALMLFGFLVSTVRLPGQMRAAMTLGPTQQYELIDQPYRLAALLLMFTTFVVGVFYSLDALHGERRDRSVLFWKSLPVSDLTTVLSKASIPLVVLPFVTVAITVATQSIMLLLHSVVLLGTGMSVTALWTHVSWFQMWLVLLYHVFLVHALWHAPFYGWLLLVSAWARRAPVVWAVVPPLAIAFAEKIAFSSSHFASMLGSRLAGGEEALRVPAAIGPSILPLAHVTPAGDLSDPGLWIGLAVTAAFLAAAVRRRRYQGPI